MSAAARGVPRGPHARAGHIAPFLREAQARTLSFAGLVLLCAVQWARLVQPAHVAQMLVVAAVAVLGAVALQRADGVRALASIVLALVVAALLATGVAPRLLLPDAWDDLARALGRGFANLALINVPYGGSEPVTTTALLLIGALLAILATLLAFAPRPHADGPRGPLPAAIVLLVMFTVPAVEAAVARPWLAGVPLALLLCAFLRLERVERHAARAALAVVLAAGIAAAVIAPRLDTDRPLLDYEALARSLTPDRGLMFSWNHSYAALTWPRTGRQMVRVRAPVASYWKVENLARFDGVRWMPQREMDPSVHEANVRQGRPEWLSTIHVSIRGLVSRLFVGSGTTIRITDSPRIPIRNAPGTFRTGPRPLRSGQEYDALVWTPRPSRQQLRTASVGPPPDWTWPYLRMELPPAQGGPLLRAAPGDVVQLPRSAQIAFPAFGDPVYPVLELRGPTESMRSADDVLRHSAYAGVYRLAQRLRAGTATPFQYVERVLRQLSRGYSYSEQPPASRVPLAAFLTRDRTGYCQQFSGAMALLLRMGGVPARVSTGFSPGTLDRDSGEYVVRDTDAHSWVEAYLAPYGWVTFDPTPVGPARVAGLAQGAAAQYAFASEGAVGVSERTGDRPTDGTRADGGSPGPWIAAGVAALVLLVGVAALLARRSRVRGAPPVDAALRELRAALARTGRPPAGGVTLQDMLRRYEGTPAEPYLRTLQAARYGGQDCAPTPKMRSALRRELTLGLGPAARLGAWRAIPPAIRRPSRNGASYPGHSGPSRRSWRPWIGR